MKNVLYVAIAAFVVYACGQKKDDKTFEVEGVIKNTLAKTVYLEENSPNGQLTILDSAQLNNGSFHLTTKAKEESFYQLRLEGKTTPMALLISDVPKIKVQADLNNTQQPYTVQGSPASEGLLTFDKKTYGFGMRLFAAGSRRDSLQNAKAPDSLVSLEYAKTEALADSLKDFAKNFLNQSKSPVLTLYALSSFQNASMNLGMPGFSQTEVTGIINDASTKFPNHAALQSIKTNMSAAKEKKPAPPVVQAKEFSQPGVDGKPISLSSFKGKYVLLDFWASWCRPCRIDNPNVVKAYNEFKDKNFTVFGVSLDQDKKAWLDAIKTDGLTWTHASDLKYWSNEAAVLYNVQGIPANFLIDPQGNIIAQDLHGDDIVNTLRQVIK